MAKQNVTFVERHVEKIVLGVAGAVLLGVAVLCLIGLHKVSVQGEQEQVSPRELYDKIRQQAKATRDRMKLASPEAAGNKLPALRNLQIDPQGSPYELWKLPTELAVVYVPLAPPAPELKNEQRGKIRLADILAPSPVVVRTGQASAKLEPPSVLTDAGAQVQESFPDVTQDWHWVTVFSALHCKDQRDKFDEAQYAADRQRLVVAGVEAERQERFPDGSWDAPQTVTGYSPRLIPVRKAADLVQLDDGTWVVRDQEAITRYKQLLDTPAGQEDILRPAFQSNLADYPPAWPAPAELPGLTIKLTDFGVITEDQQGTLQKPRPGRSPLDKTGPGTPGKDRTKLTPPQLWNQAKTALEKQQYLEAEELLNQILKTTDATEIMKKQAAKFLKENLANFEKAHQAEAHKATLAAGAAELGPDVEPLWLTDLNVTPGKTYRYRLRLLAFNPYVGNTPQLENPEDAGKIVLEGQWSVWSEPIQAKPTSCLFFTSSKTDANAAKIEIQDWVNGKWLSGNKDLKIGDPVVFPGERRHEFSYNASVVVGLNHQVNGLERTAKADGQVTYQEKPTQEIVLITADGDVQERMAVVDNQRRRDFVTENKEYDKRKGEWDKTRAGQPGQPPAGATPPPKAPKPKTTGGKPAPAEKSKHNPRE